VLYEPANLTDFQVAARERLDPVHYDYYAGGAEDLQTLEENHAGYSRLRIHYRVLRDVSRVETAVSLPGGVIPFPVLAAPTAFHRLAHAEGEVETRRGVAAAGSIMVLSSLSTRTVEDVAEASDTPLWFQLYINKDRGFTRELVARVEAAGCTALQVTVDTPRWGRREQDLRNGFHLPDGMNAVNLVRSNPESENLSHQGAGMGAALGWMLDDSLTWKDLRWLCDLTRLPVLVKGICHPEDARLSLDNGAAGVVVSNHGGRQLDYAPATISVLPEIREKLGDEPLVLIDGGVRRGTDVLKAIACGANAVQIGRPILWGLAAEGAAGVEKVLRMLRNELELCMALTGINNLEKISPDLIRKHES